MPWAGPSPWAQPCVNAPVWARYRQGPRGKLAVSCRRWCLYHLHMDITNLRPVMTAFESKVPRDEPWRFHVWYAYQQKNRILNFASKCSLSAWGYQHPCIFFQLHMSEGVIWIQNSHVFTCVHVGHGDIMSREHMSNSMWCMVYLQQSSKRCGCIKHTEFEAAILMSYTYYELTSSSVQEHYLTKN